MKYGNYDKDFITKYLESRSKLELFYILYIKSTDSGLIHYSDEDGESWCLMEDDDDLVDACILYLTEFGVPTFNTQDDLNEFEIKLKNKISF